MVLREVKQQLPHSSQGKHYISELLWQAYGPAQFVSFILNEKMASFAGFLGEFLAQYLC